MPRALQCPVSSPPRPYRGCTSSKTGLCFLWVRFAPKRERIVCFTIFLKILFKFDWFLIRVKEISEIYGLDLRSKDILSQVYVVQREEEDARFGSETFRDSPETVSRIREDWRRIEAAWNVVWIIPEIYRF